MVNSIVTFCWLTTDTLGTVKTILSPILILPISEVNCSYVEIVYSVLLIFNFVITSFTFKPEVDAMLFAVILTTFTYSFPPSSFLVTVKPSFSFLPVI